MWNLVNTLALNSQKYNKIFITLSHDKEMTQLSYVEANPLNTIHPCLAMTNECFF